MGTGVHEENESLVKTTDKSKEYLSKFRGIAVGFVSVLLYVASCVSVQLLEKRIPDLELNTMRTGVGTLLYSVSLILRRALPVIPKSLVPATCLYTLVNTACSLAMYISVTFIAAGTMQSLQGTAQIISGIILFAVFLKERITLKVLGCALLCITGILLVLQPGFAFATSIQNSWRFGEAAQNCEMKDNQTNDSFPSEASNEKNQLLGCLIAAVSGLTLALDVLIMKRNPAFNDYMLQVVLFCFVVATCLSAIAMVAFENPVLPDNWLDVCYILIHSVSFSLSWPVYIYVLQFISGNAFNVIFSTTNVFMLISQYTILQCILPGHRNWFEVIGIILVTTGTALSSVIDIFFEA